MALNVYQSLLLTILLVVVCFKQCHACDLVPSFTGTCFELAAVPFITNETSQFGPTIEGASVNPAGEMFAVNYGTIETPYQLGHVFPQQKLFYRDTNEGSFFNGIRFLNSATAFVADTRNHRVLRLVLGPDNVVISNDNYCTDTRMIQPNDLTLSKTGTVFTSGMNWVADTDDTDGDIWSCLPDGSVRQLEVLGRTNGIELSPDEKHLYVSESYNTDGDPIVQKIWRYNTNIEQGTISTKTLFADFEFIDNTAFYDIDGMKTDINGNLFVARYGARQIAIFSPQGALIGKIGLNFPNSTNLEFGGPTGTSLFIVGQCEQEGKGCVDRIEVNAPGRSWTMLQASAISVFQRNKYLQTMLLLIIPLMYFTVKI